MTRTHSVSSTLRQHKITSCRLKQAGHKRTQDPNLNRHT